MLLPSLTVLFKASASLLKGVGSRDALTICVVKSRYSRMHGYEFVVCRNVHSDATIRLMLIIHKGISFEAQCLRAWLVTNERWQVALDCPRF